jgi:hypothetical protein
MEREWTHLKRWARDRGMILPSDLTEPEPSESAEHDVTFRTGERRWWKYTKPNHAGLGVTWEGEATPYVHNASPLEYLDRLRAANLLLADDIRLEGLWRNPAGAWRIVTRQADVPGTPAERDEIIGSLAQAGWILQPQWSGVVYHRSLTFRRGDWLMTDAHPANFVRTADGLVIPIDVILAKHRPFPSSKPF